MPMAEWAEWAEWICKKDRRAQRVQTVNRRRRLTRISPAFLDEDLQALVHGPSFLRDAGAQLVQTIFVGGKLVGEEKLAYATQLELHCGL